MLAQLVSRWCTASCRNSLCIHIYSLLNVMERPISSFPLPWKAQNGDSEYAKFLNGEALQIYRCHHTAPNQVRHEMAQKRWAVRKCMQEFDTATKLQKQRKLISERRDALAAFVAELEGQLDAPTIKECEIISCSVEPGGLVRVGGIMKGPNQQISVGTLPPRLIRRSVKVRMTKMPRTVMMMIIAAWCAKRVTSPWETSCSLAPCAQGLATKNVCKAEGDHPHPLISCEV